MPLYYSDATLNVFAKSYIFLIKKLLRFFSYKKSKSNSFYSDDLNVIDSGTGNDDNDPTDVFSILSKLKITIE